MIILAACAGLICGALVIWAMWQSGMLAERSGIAVLLVAIAFFYPVFAVMDEAGWLSIALHTTVFLAFAALATAGFRRGLPILAGGIIAHGVFDLFSWRSSHPGPEWWPAFCGTLDIVAGLCLLYLIQTKRVAP